VKQVVLKEGLADFEMARSKISKIAEIPIPVPESGDATLHATAVGPA